MKKPHVHVQSVEDYTAQDRAKTKYKLVKIGSGQTWSRTHIYCSGCGQGALYQNYEQEDTEYKCKCPFCGTTFIHFEDDNTEE